jgi:hypothetical protein
MIELSVVIAAQDAGPNLKRCVDALTPQLPPAELEILVVGSSGKNVPQLWSEGIGVAHGKIVALTIENCTPASDWARRMIQAQAGPWSAIGGAIEIEPGANLVDWAVYFCRYSAYMPPFEPRLAEDPPGDNCSYKSEALGRVRGLMGDGFWETLIHGDMRGRGEQLRLDPSVVVTYCGGLSAWRFFRRRYIHGRYFAGRRSGGMSRPRRWMRGAAFPAVALVLVHRIGRRVWKKRRHRAKFLAALPLICCFLLAWAAGESAGYFRGSSAGVPPGTD